MIDQDQQTILIVDDEATVRLLLKRTLQKAGYVVIEKDSGDAALLHLANNPLPDLVLLDSIMPEKGGLEVLQEIRKTWAQTILPVVSLTGETKEESLVAYFRSGINDYIRKPFIRDELLARIETQIRLAKMAYSLSRFVPNEFLRLLGKENLLDVRLGDQIERTITVLFNDIRSFTKISEKMNPRENFDFINSYLSRIGPIVRNNNGFIDKYIGDAVMALFPHDPQDAVNTAIAIARTVEEYNLTRSNETDPKIAVGSGINNGTLMLGVIGENQRMEGTVISDAVNTASRLEGLTKIYKVKAIASENTLVMLGPISNKDYRYCDRVLAKGKTSEITIYEILACNTPDENALIQSYMPVFEDAIQAFLKGDYPSAYAIFSDLAERNPHDGVVEFYVGRINFILRKDLVLPSA